jgi:threonine/homoserine/homoserine lactone efflux protein
MPSMSSLLVFLAGAAVLSLSGVLAPGPITAVTVGKGSRSPHAGAWIAVGHGLVEIPLMILLAVGVGRFFTDPAVKPVFGLLGGAVLIWMAIGMLRSVHGAVAGATVYAGSPLAAGVMLSLSSPYFFLWWATVGISLILRSWTFGLLGFAALCIVHWLCDFLWDYFLSALSFAGGKFFGMWFQRAVFAVCGLALIGFGGWFLYDAVTSLLA